MITRPKIPVVEVGVVQCCDDDIPTGVPFWRVYYKGISFGDFNELEAAARHLKKLMELDLTRESSTVSTEPEYPY